MPESSSLLLAAYLRRAAREAGYDTDTPRSGGMKLLAEASGLPQSTLSRILNGISMPTMDKLQELAKTLRVPLMDLLLESGLVSRDTASATSAPLTYTPEDAARLALFVAFVNRLRDTRSDQQS